VEGFHLVEEGGKPFEGFLCRTSDRLKVNYFRLLHYATERAFKKTDAYAAAHSDATINTQTAAVCFDHVVVATQYIGPIPEP
jgi:hypothetical protein